MKAGRWSHICPRILFFAAVCSLVGDLRANDKDDLRSALEKAGRFYAQRDFAASAAEYERAMELAPRVLPGRDETFAYLCYNLALAYAKMQQYAKAEPLYLRSIKHDEAAHGPSHLDIATTLKALADLYCLMGQHAKAVPHFERSLKIRETILGPDDPQLAYSLDGLAEMYSDICQYAKAETYIQRSLKIRQNKLGPNHPEVADSLCDLASLRLHLGQYALAEPLLQRALKIYETSHGPNHEDVANVINSLAILYRNLKQYAKAEILYQRSLKTYETNRGPDHPRVAHSLNNLATLYMLMNRLEEAESLFDRALKIFEARFGADHQDTARVLFGLANVNESLGKYELAQSQFQRSLNILETALGANHERTALGHYSLGVLYMEIGNYERAELHLKRSQAGYEASVGSGHRDLASVHDVLAAVYDLTGRFSLAASTCEKRRRITRQHVADILPILSEMEQLNFIRTEDAAPYARALSLGRRHPKEPAFAEQSSGWLFNGKSVVQESLAERALLARDSVNPASADAIKQLAALRTELAGLSLMVAKPEHQAEHRRRLAEMSQKEQQLARQISQAAGRPVCENPWVEPTAVRAALAADAVLVDIARFSPFDFGAKKAEPHWEAERYVAWVVPPTGKGNVQIVDLGDAETLDQAIESARQAIELSASKIKQPEDEATAEQAALAALAKLAELVLTPLKPHLQGARQIILSPDSNLWLVPWAALPAAEGEYAIERWQFRYVTSGRELAAEKLSDQSAIRTLSRPRIFADPDYDLNGKASLVAIRAVLRDKQAQLAMRTVSVRSANGLAKVGRLPATAVEAKLVAPSLEQYAHEAPTVYSNQYALEGVLKAITSPRVLVLSTHGYYLQNQQAKTAGSSSPAGEHGFSVALAAEGQPLENPLLRCGLLLAGCNQPPTAGVDDGVLTGMEIVGCDLRGTELVVLSACQTGLGQVRNGEGVAGLRQAFQLAGAKAVVSTLWRIPDAETATLMSDFFANLAAGQSKAEALRNAQISMITTRRQATGIAHPFYWAAFTVTGN